MWWTKEMDLPPLVTTSPVGTPPDLAGVLGQPGTAVLFGNEGVIGGLRSGGRLTLGCWLGPDHCSSIEAGYFGIGEAHARFRASSDTTPILARPFFDAEGNSQAAMLVAYPDLLRGSVAVDASSELQTAEVLWRRPLFVRCGSRADLLLGYRFARLDESSRVAQSSEFIGPAGVIIPGTTKDLFDQFDTENQFHGGELGLAYERRAGRWSLETAMKVALGNTMSRVSIDGATRTVVPGEAPVDFVGGLLAQQTNMGRHDRNGFTVMPEFRATLACDLTRRLRATFGYTLLYWTGVARPGEHIDFDVSQFPPEPPAGARAPEFRFTAGDFWAQGMHFGLDYRF